MSLTTETHFILFDLLEPDAERMRAHFLELIELEARTTAGAR